MNSINDSRRPNNTMNIKTFLKKSKKNPKSKPSFPPSLLQDTLSVYNNQDLLLESLPLASNDSVFNNSKNFKKQNQNLNHFSNKNSTIFGSLADYPDPPLGYNTNYNLAYTSSQYSDGDDLYQLTRSHS